MPKQNARDLLVKSGTEIIAGLTTRTINLNGNLVDITSFDDVDANGTVWRTSLAGIQMLDFDGSGYFADKTQAVSFLDAKNGGTYLSLEVIVPGLGSFTGSFAVGNLSFGAETEGAVTMSLQMQSSGPVTFTAEV